MLSSKIVQHQSSNKKETCFSWYLLTLGNPKRRRKRKINKSWRITRTARSNAPSIDKGALSFDSCFYVAGWIFHIPKKYFISSVAGWIFYTPQTFDRAVAGIGVNYSTSCYTLRCQVAAKEGQILFPIKRPTKQSLYRRLIHYCVSPAICQLSFPPECPFSKQKDLWRITRTFPKSWILSLW